MTADPDEHAFSGTSGAVPMRPLALGEILDGAMGLLRRYPAATLGMGAVVMAIQFVLTVPIQYLTQDYTFSLFAPNAVVGSLDPLLWLLGLAVSTSLIGLVAAACAGLVSGLTASVVGDTVLGRPVSVRTVWLQVRSRLWPLIGLALLIGLASSIGSLFLVGWLFIAGVMAVAIPVLVLERAGPITAIKRSWNLTIRDFFRVLGIRLLALFVGYILQFLLALPFTLLAQVALYAGTNGLPTDGRVFLSVLIAALGTFAGGVFSMPFLGCVDALLYTDRRMRAEGLDIELGQRMRRAQRVAA